MPALAILTSLIVSGNVEATEARWSDDDTIVTESKVRADDGSLVTVVQLGGTVDGVGMRFTHLPPPLRRGDTVALIATAAGAHVVVQTAKSSQPRLAAAPASAAYGLQRTSLSGKPLYRDSGCIRVVYDEAGTAQIPRQLELATLDLAFAQWELSTTSCSALDFEHSIATGVAAARDGIDTVRFRDDRWCRPANATTPEVCYPPDVAAVTRLAFVDIPGDPEDGKILDADIEINAVHFALQIDGATNASTATPIDLLSVVTHEAGHLLGLAHNCGTDDAPWPTDRDGLAVPACANADTDHVAATMFVQVAPGDTSKRTLERSDMLGACAAVAAQRCTAELTAGCSASRPSSNPLLWLGAALLSAGRVSRRRCRRPAQLDAAAAD